MLKIPAALVFAVATTGVAAYAISAQHAASPTVRTHPAPAHPTVLELFQSQGCSSCPPALEVLRQEADRPDVIALNFAVTYWDRLGWKDRFAKPAFTNRQWDYARFNRRAEVATPQLIVNGVGFVNGGDRTEVDRAIVRFAATRPGPPLAAQGQTLSIGAGPTSNDAIIWVVSYDPRTLSVPIGSGENAGRTLPHRNIVRELTSLGSWGGRAKQLKMPAAMPGLKRALLIQAGLGGPIIAASLLN